jgi:hypothetical protein
MKALSIQQPWGSLIACGLKDIENRTSRMLVPPQRVLIHVGAKFRSLDLDNLFLCWELPVRNAESIGQFDRDMAFSKSAIIGYVDVVDIVQNSQSVWAQYAPDSSPKQFQHYVLRNAHLFKEPILNVKGRLGVWDIPEIDENNLPETVDIPKFEVQGDTLVFPCNDNRWRIINNWLNSDEETLIIPYYLLDDNLDLFIKDKESYAHYPYKSLILTHKGESLKVNVTKIDVEDMYFSDTKERITFETPSGKICDAKEIIYEFSRSDD